MGCSSPLCSFAYRATMQQSTGESLFFLLYGRDPQLQPCVSGGVGHDLY